MCIFGVQKDFLIPFKAEHSVGMGGGPESASYFQTTMPSQGERGGTGQEKHFSVSNGKKSKISECWTRSNTESSLHFCLIQGHVPKWLRIPQWSGESSNASTVQGIISLRILIRPTTVIAQRRMKQLLHVSLVMAKGHNEIKLSIRR